MATSSRPRRKIHRRSVDYDEGLLHEEELAIRRALQASLIASKSKSDDSTDKDKGNSSTSQHQNVINHKKEIQHNNNHIPDHKEKKTRKTRLKETQEIEKSIESKAVNTSAKKKQKLQKEDSVASRSRSSSLNSSSTIDSFNSSSSNSKVSAKTMSSSASQTRIKSSKIQNPKSPKKEKLAVKIRKTLLKKKLKEARMGSDCESTVSGSTTSEAVTIKKTRRSRKRKNSSTFVQKKFASVTPSPTKTTSSTLEIDTLKPLGKAEDFIDFLCLRGHPLMPKDLDIFHNPYKSSVCEEDFPSSPPSSLLSEVQSSPSPFLPHQYSVDSPSCDTPTFDAPNMGEDGLHAMRMYAGIENRRKEMEDDGNKGEITIADLESEEEPHKNTVSVTPPLSFRVSPSPAPPLPKGTTSTSGSTIIPSPAPQMTISPSTSGLDANDKPRVLYPTPETPSFGPPPLMLSQRRLSGSGGCCSPPPLLYIPAAAQRVTHLHGPPKLERVHSIHSDSVVEESPPILTRHSLHNVEVKKMQEKDDMGITNTSLEKGTKSNLINELSGDQKLISEEHLQSARPSSVDVSSNVINDKARSLRSPTEDSVGLATDSRTSCCYIRNTQSCPPLHCDSDLRRLEQARKDLNTDSNNSSSTKSGVPLVRPSSQGANTGVISTHVGYNSRYHGPCSVHFWKQSESSPPKRTSTSVLSIVESPHSTTGLASSSMLDNLQRAHDNFSSLSSPSGSISSLPSFTGHSRLSPSPRKVRSFTNSGKTPESSSRMLTPSDTGDERSSPMNCDSYLSLIRERSIYSPSSEAEPFVARQTAITFPSQGDRKGTLIPPWSHMQASYPSGTTPPRPYTLSVHGPMSSFDHRPFGVNTQHIVPRTIPLLPPNQVPLIPSNQHVSVPFNGKFLLNQHKLPSAFESSTHTKDNCSSLGNDRSISLDGFASTRPTGMGGTILNETQQTASSNDSLKGLPGTQSLLPHVAIVSDVNNSGVEIGRGSPQSFGESTSRESSIEPNSRNQSVGMAEKSHDLNTPMGDNHKPRDISPPIAATEGSCDKKAKVARNLDSPGQHDKEGGNLDVKKRRGRPPGSKNKKTNSDKAADKDSTGNSSSKNEPNDAKEKNESNSKSPLKKKKIECPILRPTDEEFKDPIAYLKSVRSTLEKFGICIIDPPESWKLESHLPGNPRFTTKRQLIHRLQKRWGPTEVKLACIEKHLKQQQSTFNLTQMPVVGGCDLDLAEVSRVVMEHGGMQKVIDNKKWNKVADLLKIPKSTQDRIGKVQDAYCKYLLSFDLLPEADKASLENEIKKEMDSKGDAEEYRSECHLKGRSFSMGCFQRTARNFQEHFFKTDPSVNDVEREYWKIVQSRDKYVAVHHVKLDTKEHGTCFPSNKTDPYTKNGWNLNVLSHLKGSILKHAGNVEDLTIPWLNIDMLFSTKRWTTTPLDTYLIDFLHSSNDKVWYGVPESDIEQFPHTKKHNTNDYEDGEFMVSPSNLSRETGLNVTRLEQKQGQFVVIAPKVFHCFISSGYSVSETVSFAFPDWILRTSSLDLDLFANWPGFSYEKLLLKSIEEVSSAGKECLESLHNELQKIRDKEVSTRKELKDLGVTECKTTNTTTKGVQTIEASNGSVQVNATTMYCGMCQRLSHLSAVLSEEDSEILCLSDAVSFIGENKPTEPLSIVTNYSLSQLDESISLVAKKLEQL